MKFGVADMELNFVPGTEQNSQMGMPRKEWNQKSPRERIFQVIDLIHSNGFDFVELGCPWLNNSVDDQVFEDLFKFINEKNIKVEALCSLVPGDIKTAGPELDLKKLRNYLELVFSRAEKLGVKAIVFGSGVARNIPDNYDYQKGIEDFKQSLTLCADIIEQNNYNFKIGIESLNKNESNLINDIEEAYNIAKELNRDSIGLTLDVYHCTRQESELFENLKKYAPISYHIHLNQPENRNWPGNLSSKDDSFDFKTFFNSLVQSGYSYNASVECIYRDLTTELKPTINYLEKTTKGL